MLLKNSMKILCLTIGGVSLMGCATDGAGTRNVTCESVKFVWLSRKDTQGTIRQVTANNGAWVALCGDPGAAPKNLDDLPTKAVVKVRGKTRFIDRWRIWRP